MVYDEGPVVLTPLKDLSEEALDAATLPVQP
jgi:hypothetical protein